MTDAGSIIVVGAGPGLGMAVARRFGREGFGVGLIGRRLSSVDQVVDELAAEKIEALAAAADVSDRVALHGALDSLTSALGVPDVLVYNASAGSAPGLPSEAGSATILSVLAAGVGGLADAVERVLPGMCARRSGTVLVTGSAIAIDPWVEATALSVGKAAQRHFTHALHREVIEDDIHATTITIHGVIAAGTAFDAQVIAEEFWTVHSQPRAEWTWEHPYAPDDTRSAPA
jgi:NADP-dependent 3-hydroxy acid dehydrogenase YdfG